MADIITAFKPGDAVYCFDDRGQWLSTTVLTVNISPTPTSGLAPVDPPNDVLYTMATPDSMGNAIVRRQQLTWVDKAAAIAYVTSA
jgi:hypothetical protein